MLKSRNVARLRECVSDIDASLASTLTDHPLTSCTWWVFVCAPLNHEQWYGFPRLYRRILEVNRYLCGTNLERRRTLNSWARYSFHLPHRIWAAIRGVAHDTKPPTGPSPPSSVGGGGGSASSGGGGGGGASSSSSNSTSAVSRFVSLIGVRSSSSSAYSFNVGGAAPSASTRGESSSRLSSRLFRWHVRAPGAPNLRLVTAPLISSSVAPPSPRLLLL